MPLPQEIVNFIIDLVAWEKPRKAALNTLRTCSLVSISFYPQSRKHIFSEIEFCADQTAQKRAEKLFRILDHERNRDLVPGIRAFKLIIDITPRSPQKMLKSAGVGQFYRRSSTILIQIARRFGVRQNYLLELLELLTRAPLESFAIEGQNGVLNWNSVGERARSLFLTILSCSSSSLKSLRFINITNLDRTLVAGKESSSHLRELGLWNITLNPLNGMPALLSNTNLEGIERLDVLPRSDYLHIFPQPSSSSPSHCLPRLGTLVVAFPMNLATLDILWQFIKTFAASLKTLEIMHIWWLYLGPLPASICLSHLSVLQNLKLCAASKYPDDPLYLGLETIYSLLTSATSPLAIQHITIDLEIRSNTIDASPRQTLYPGIGTNALDLALTGPMLVNLQTVVFDLKLVTYISTKSGNRPEGKSQAINDADVRNLLPHVSASPSIKLEVSIEAVFRKNRDMLLISPS